MNTIKIKKLHPDATLPTRTNPTDAGLDLYACLQTFEDRQSKTHRRKVKLRRLKVVKDGQEWNGEAFQDKYTLESDEIVAVSTQIAVEIPEGYYGQIADRSSMGKRGIKVFGGVIDSGYRGELVVCLGNLSTTDHTIEHGDKIAQLLLLPVATPQVEEVDELSDSERGERGFGSSGR